MEGHIITIKAAYGDFDKELELSKLPGMYWHIYLDRYYMGKVDFRDGRWTVLPQGRSNFETADIDEIERLVNEWEDNNG